MKSQLTDFALELLIFQFTVNTRGNFALAQKTLIILLIAIILAGLTNLRRGLKLTIFNCQGFALVANIIQSESTLTLDASPLVIRAI